MPKEHDMSPLAADPFGKEAYDVLKDMLSERVRPKRLKHSVNVAKVARRLAKAYGADPDKARLAGILHDWDKGLDNEQLRDRAIELKVDVDEMVLTDMPWLLHGPTAAAALSRAYPQFGADVFQAIERHTSGAADMAPLDCIIYVADIIEPNRTFGDMEGIERLRGLVGEIPLEELYFEAFKYTLQFLVSTDRVLYPATIDTWNILMRTYGHIAKEKIDIWNIPALD
ncbi:MAG: bis(5'-nucleosyl)-tetraphosphatase (symmetrical) YqeK [Eggerthellaceae bacterium]|nr:bis(5'-nucleosyl)-tetraphosphatase (symmetrical) YqeK [Eggerthellaceae bacterium]